MFSLPRVFVLLRKKAPSCLLNRHRNVFAHQSPASLLLFYWETLTLKPPTLARHHNNYLHSNFTTGGPGKEYGTNEPLPTGRI